MSPTHEPEIAELKRQRAAFDVLTALSTLPSYDAYRVLGWVVGRCLTHVTDTEERRAILAHIADAQEAGRSSAA